MICITFELQKEEGKNYQSILQNKNPFNNCLAVYQGCFFLPITVSCVFLIDTISELSYSELQITSDQYIFFVRCFPRQNLTTTIY